MKRTDDDNGSREYGVQQNLTRSQYITRLLRGPVRPSDKTEGAHIGVVRSAGNLIYYGHTHAAPISLFTAPYILESYEGRPLTTAAAPSDADRASASAGRDATGRDIRFEVFYRNYLLFRDPGPWENSDNF